MTAELDAVADGQQHRAHVACDMYRVAVGLGMRSRTRRLEHVVGDDQPARCQFRVQQPENGYIEILPKIDEHQIEGPLERSEALERIADHEVDVAGEPGARELLARVFGLGGAQLEGGDLTPHCTRGFRQPDSRVAEGAADLEDAARAGFLGQQVDQAPRGASDRQQHLIDARLGFLRTDLVPHLLLARGARLVFLEYRPDRRVHRWEIHEKYSCSEATPSRLASNRLSRCSRELTSPRARSTPCSSSSAANGRRLTW